MTMQDIEVAVSRVGVAARIWAWLGVFLLTTALDVVIDVVERIHVNGYHYHGTDPRSFDIILSIASGIGLTGLMLELINAWRTRVKLPTPVRTVRSTRRWR